ncbi:hypothetical protein BOX15_Mlig008224g3, partial [Macrostomum lignano]
ATVTMPNTSHAAPGVTSPTIFDSVDTVCYNGGGNSGGVLFCIDTSGSMHSKLPAVRSELVELLNRWSGSSRRFNLIRFGAGSLQRWSEGMVDCTPAAIVDADRWLSIGGTSGCCSDTRAALTTASVEAKNCGASSVCLVTDSLPEATLTSSEMSSLPLPVHCVYPKESELTPQPGLMAELQQIAGATGGSLTVANVSHRGVIERVAPVARTAPPATRWGRPGGQQVPPAINGGKLCSVTASLRCDPLLDAPALLFEGEDRDGWRFVYSNQGPPGTHWGGSWSKFQASRPRVRAAERGASPPRSPPPSIAGVSLLGRRVLARRRSDGLFYEGTVLSEASTPGQFNVELQTNRPKNCAGKDGFSDTEYQITPVGELIALDDALRRQLLPGDCVLAPRGPNRPDYGPAIVLDGYELRRRQAAAGDRVEDQPDDSVDDCKSGVACDRWPSLSRTARAAWRSRERQFVSATRCTTDCSSRPSCQGGSGSPWPTGRPSTRRRLVRAIWLRGRSGIQTNSKQCGRFGHQVACFRKLFRLDLTAAEALMAAGCSTTRQNTTSSNSGQTIRIGAPTS